jgi:protein-disulfide isomerase
MKNIKYIIFSLIFLIISLIIFFVVKTDTKYDEVVKENKGSNNLQEELSIEDKNQLRQNIVIEKSSDIIYGEENAEITIIEYASYSCFHCSDFHKNIYPKIYDDFIVPGKVRFIYRDFPLDSASLKASQLVRCMAAENKSKFKNLLLESQKSWAFTKEYAENLENLARISGMSSAEFNKCFNNKEYETQILQERLDVFNAFNISSTPSFIINGKKYNGGNNWYEISEFLNNLLNKDYNNE